MSREKRTNYNLANDLQHQVSLLRTDYDGIKDDLNGIARRANKMDAKIDNRTNDLQNQISSLKSRVHGLEKKQIEDKQLLMQVVQSMTSAIENLRKK